MLTAAVVIGGLAITIGVSWLMYRRNVIARRRYVVARPTPRVTAAMGDRADHPSA
jgi:nitrate reductase gamma subunit